MDRQGGGPARVRVRRHRGRAMGRAAEPGARRPSADRTRDGRAHVIVRPGALRPNPQAQNSEVRLTPVVGSVYNFVYETCFTVIVRPRALRPTSTEVRLTRPRRCSLHASHPTLGAWSLDFVVLRRPSDHGAATRDVPGASRSTRNERRPPHPPPSLHPPDRTTLLNTTQTSRVWCS